MGTMSFSTADMMLCTLEIWGAIIFFFAAVYTLYAERNHRTPVSRISSLEICSFVMMVADVIAFFTRGKLDRLSFYFYRIGMLIVFSFGYICMIAFCRYVLGYLKPDKLSKGCYHTIHVMSAIGFSFPVINIFTDLYYYFDDANIYHRARFFIPCQLFSVLPFLVLAVLILHNKKELGRNKTLAFLSYIIFPAIALLIQVRHYTIISCLNIGLALSIMLMVLVIFVEQRDDILRQEREILQKEEELVRKEREINEMQIRIVISQIQPHFLYNALNSIYYLCEKDVHEAQEAINNFSMYLRGNMDALRATEPVDFSEEFSHVKYYLALEKMRFEDELEVVFDIETEDFKIPALCLQPVVENAVKHGVGMKQDGGTVTIRTVEMSDTYEILVEDDGVGFDVNEKRDDSRSHVGIENVNQRLFDMVGGSLTVHSRIGEGTVAVIQIPKHHCGSSDAKNP